MNNPFSSCYKNINDDNSETINYNNEFMPLKSFVSTTYSQPVSYINHWHTDFEFAYCAKGSFYYNVNGKEIVVKHGQMIFVNSAQMHYSYQKEAQESEIYCAIFHPQIFDVNLAKKYLDIVTNSDVPPYLILSIEDPGEKKIIDLVVNLVKVNKEKDFGHELEIQGMLYKMLPLLTARVQNTSYIKSPATQKKLEVIRRMTGFVQKNYAEKITLDDIADAGIVCRSRACDLFKAFMKKTPIEYLNDYRISKSMDFLSSTNMTVTEVSQECGFLNPSYFTEIFHKRMNMTPKEYRNLF